MHDEVTLLDPAPCAAPAGELLNGTVLNGLYRVKTRLGAGGMGEVYRAINLANDEVDAIKIIGRGCADRTLIEAMFRKEARVLSRIQSPAVARLKLFLRDPALDLLYFVTEFVPGESLLDRLRRQPAGPGELRTLMRRVLTGLQAVHEADAVHRDLSPDNIILPDGDVAQAKIIDFGIAKELDPAHTTMIGDRFAGKLGYIAPEQLGFSGARIGPWTDLYSLALVGIAFAAGGPLAMGHTLGGADEKRRQPIDLSATPPDLRSFFAQLLAYDWRDRPPSAAQALRLLDESVATPSPAEDSSRIALEVAPGPPGDVPLASRTRSWRRTAGVASAALTAVGLAAVGVWHGRPQQDQPMATSRALVPATTAASDRNRERAPASPVSAPATKSAPIPTPLSTPSAVAALTAPPSPPPAFCAGFALRFMTNDSDATREARSAQLAKAWMRCGRPTVLIRMFVDADKVADPLVAALADQLAMGIHRNLGNAEVRATVAALPKTGAATAGRDVSAEKNELPICGGDSPSPPGCRKAPDTPFMNVRFANDPSSRSSAATPPSPSLARR